MLDKHSKRLWKLVVAILVATIAGLAFWDSTPEEKWIEQALSHTGQVIEVSRVVEFTFGGGDLSQAFTRWPNKFSLEFTHPANGRRIAWHGEKNIHPILLDVVDGVPWLVLNSHLVYSNVELYGCPEVPYAFLKYDLAKSRWIPVSSGDAPTVLREANLSYDWQAYAMRDNRRQTASEIAARRYQDESSTANFFSGSIPRTYAEWKYLSKKRVATSRWPNDCRPPLEQPVDVIFPKDQSLRSHPVQLEVLESKSFDPEWVIKEDPNARESQWSKYSWDKERSQACNAFTRLADQQDARLTSWRTFVGDPTGKRLFAPGHMLCDPNAIWFFSYVAEPGRVVIVKTTTNGEILYRASFAQPDQVVGYLGAIMNPTLHETDGYLYFDWWNSNQAGADRHIKRTLKVRFSEPPSVVPVPINEVSR